MPMNPEVKAKWVSALRSGEYKQGREQLKFRDEFCCLGVLCDLYAKEHGVAFDHSLRANEGDDELPAAQVCEWAEIEDNDPELSIGHETRCVSLHNDGTGRIDPKTFAQIADAIEEQL